MREKKNCKLFIFNGERMHTWTIFLKRFLLQRAPAYAVVSLYLDKKFSGRRRSRGVQWLLASVVPSKWRLYATTRLQDALLWSRVGFFFQSVSISFYFTV